jgi:hypothetical protein
VPMVGAKVTATQAGFTTVVTGGTIGSSTTDAVVAITVGGVATKTTASANATKLSWGDTTSQLSVSLSAGADQGGTLQLQRLVGTTWQDEGSAVSAVTGATVPVLPVASWGTGAVQLQVVFSGASNGSGAWAGSTSAAVTITVERPTTSTLAFAYDAGSSATSGVGTLTATIAAPGSPAAAPAGTVTFTAGGTDIPTCKKLSVPTTAPYTVTCPGWTPTPKTTTTVVVTFTGGTGFADSQGSTSVTSS